MEGAGAGEMVAHDVFISHASNDKPIADAVCAALEGAGIRCWVAPRDVMPGADWGAAIVEGIKGSRAMVLVFSAAANTSRHITREVERALHQGIAVIPLRIQDVPFEGSLEYHLGSVHWLDALSPPLEAHLKSLVTTVSSIVGKDARPEAVPANVGATDRRQPEPTTERRATTEELRSENRADSPRQPAPGPRRDESTEMVKETVGSHTDLFDFNRLGFNWFPVLGLTIAAMIAERTVLLIGLDAAAPLLQYLEWLLDRIVFALALTVVLHWVRNPVAAGASLMIATVAWQMLAVAIGLNHVQAEAHQVDFPRPALEILLMSAVQAVAVFGALTLCLRRFGTRASALVLTFAGVYLLLAFGLVVAFGGLGESETPRILLYYCVRGAAMGAAIWISYTAFVRTKRVRSPRQSTS